VKEKLTHLLPQLNSVDVNDLEKHGIAHWLALAYVILYLILLVYLLVSGTLSEFARKFLSLTILDPYSAECVQIPVSITGKYLADKNGVWSTNSDYNHATSTYQLTMEGTAVTDAQFSSIMSNFTGQLQQLGEKFGTFDVASSLIAWSLYSATDANTNMKLQPFVQIGQVFSMFTIIVRTFSSSKGVCLTNDYPLPLYNSKAMTLTVYFPPGGQLGGFCPDQISANKTFEIQRSPFHSVDLDMASMMTAFALNFGIIDTSMLKRAVSAPSDVPGQRIEGWINTDYPAMNVVLCIVSSNKPRYCGVNVGSDLVYPVFSTLDLLSSPPSVCSCPKDALSPSCNIGRILQVTLMFATQGDYSQDVNDGVLEATAQRLQQTIADDPVDGPGKVRQLVSSLGFTAGLLNEIGGDSYTAWLAGGAPPISSMLTHEEYNSRFGELGPGVSLLTVTGQFMGSLNNAGVQLGTFASASLPVANPYEGNTTGLVMCTDTIFQPTALSVMMQQDPPVPVVQPYVSCHPTLTNAFFTAAGLAAANSALISTVFLGLAVVAIVQYINVVQHGKGGKVVPPSEKFQELITKTDRLSADNEKLLADVALLKSIVLRNQHQHQHQQQQQQQQQQHMATTGSPLPPLPPPPPLPPSTSSTHRASLSGIVISPQIYGENPLHRRSSLELRGSDNKIFPLREYDGYEPNAL